MAFVTICPSVALKEAGPGVRFGLGEISGFVVRYQGQVRAFRNRCPHRGLELDWQEGHFFDSDGSALICAVHGARYDPAGGRCLEGPCRGASLEALVCEERLGWVVVQELDICRV